MMSIRLHLIPLAGVLMTAAFPLPAFPKLEAHFYAVTDYIAECPAPNIPYHEIVGDAWYNNIDTYGVFSRRSKLTDGNMKRGRFCDPDSGFDDCEDHLYIDNADVALIAVHGADNGDNWQALLRRDGGAKVNDCTASASQNNTDATMRLGDVDLEFLHMSSSHSMDDDNLAQTYRMFEDPTDSPETGRRLHQANGFHGAIWVGTCCDDAYHDFAEDAHHMSIRDAWMDHMAGSGINNSAIQCPVSYAVGVDKADCFNRLDNESYGDIRKDPESIGYYCYYYYADCDPDGETPFNNPDA